MRTNELMLYRNMEYGRILDDMTFLMEHAGSDFYNPEDLRGLYFECINEILELSESHGLEGNLWHTYLTFLLVNDENAYSTACEMRGQVEGSINDVALHDFSIMKELFDYDLRDMEKKLGVSAVGMILDYAGTKQDGHVYNRRVRDRICELACHLGKTETKEQFKDVMTQFYKEFGVGKFGLHKAFRIEHTEKGARIVPITKIAHVKLDDLVGYEIPKQKLTENTEAFVNRRRANNCLLFGDAGTGKSSSIKAILNQYYDQGLRMIEVYKHQFQDLNDVIAQIKSRNYRFIIYMDDLSFEEFEIEYKYLKAVIEGGLERKPENVLIYATSNRRHLVREQWSDKEGRRDDLHASDTVQEKLSLVARFGVSIFFVGPGKKEFQNIVLELARRNGIDMPEEELLLQANKWEMTHGGKSGRTAQQFIDYLLGKE
ncbi:ATP-binding protein [Sellimonas sp.]|uniref:ATP-binding protein n=1 Tax=Sellimonas sp. TaxID=2021466 RepID=UPI000B37C730|nr:ATP-binding protein [Sellimonas sp.]OUP64994.1 AAA family ATPase [Drancourtella sp. An177]